MLGRFVGFTLLAFGIYDLLIAGQAFMQGKVLWFFGSIPADYLIPALAFTLPFYWILGSLLLVGEFHIVKVTRK